MFNLTHFFIARHRTQEAVKKVFNVAVYMGDAINALRIAKENDLPITEELMLIMLRELRNSKKSGPERARQYVALMDPFGETFGVPFHDELVQAILSFDPTLKAEICQHRMNGFLRVKFLQELLAEDRVSLVSLSSIALALNHVSITRQTVDELALCRKTIERSLELGELTAAYNVAMLLPGGSCLPEELWKLLLQQCISTWGTDNSSNRRMIVRVAELSLQP